MFALLQASNIYQTQNQNQNKYGEIDDDDIEDTYNEYE